MFGKLAIAGVTVIAAMAIATSAAHGSNGSAVAKVQTAGSSTAAAREPGTDPGIQGWFLRIEKARIAFDNVLIKAERDVSGGTGTANCSALVSATAAIKQALPRLNSIPNGGPAIAAAYGPPIDRFAAVAAACVRGDFATARSSLGDTKTGAIAAYGAAQETVDELLDGGA